MATRPWTFSDNPFLNATDQSFRLALHIGRYHNDALLKNGGAVVWINAMYTAFNPLFLALDTAFDQFVSLGGIREGGTLNLRQLLRQLSGIKARAWDIAIQNVYPLDTPQYMALLPDRRIPFQTGSQILRINAVNSLSISIGTDASLAAVKSDVNAFYLLLDAALAAQGGNKSAQQIASDAVEAARVAMCVAMYGDLGTLMMHYAANPDMILPYFDVAAMRKGQQVIFTDNHVKPETVHFIVKHTFGPTDMVEIENLGDAELRFYLAPNKNDPTGSGSFGASPHTKQLVPAAALGNLTDTYLHVQNLNPLIEGQFVLDLNPIVP